MKRVLCYDENDEDKVGYLRYDMTSLLQLEMLKCYKEESKQDMNHP